jgi:drug/metabolite transporter (DMT)-like permease
MLLVVLGVVCTGFAHTLFIASMRRVSAHTAAVVAALEPVYGIALAAWLLGEWPDTRTLAGGALIVLAALVASRRAT